MRHNILALTRSERGAVGLADDSGHRVSVQRAALLEPPHLPGACGRLLEKYVKGKDAGERLRTHACRAKVRGACDRQRRLASL
eukprot:2368382-Rhodomonas_salina.4